MRSSLEQFERVSDYVSGTMPEADRALFELELKNDPHLQEQVGFQRDMIRMVERKALRAEISVVAAQYAAAGGMSLLAKMLLGTGTLAVIGALAFWMLSSGNEQPNQASRTSVSTTEPVEVPITKDKPVADNRQTERVIATRKVDSGWFVRRIIDRNDPLPLITAITETPQPPVRTVTFASISEDSLMRSLVGQEEGATARAKKSTYTASWSISSLKRSVFKRSTEGQKAALRSTAVVKIADLEGSPINDARMTFTLFGETQTVDVNGTYAFKLYQDVRTNVVVEFGNGERVIIESVEFSPRRTTFVQIETVLPDSKPVKREE